MRAFSLTGDYRIAVVDIPLLFETGGEKNFDKVIVTACPEETQLARLRERGLTEERARERVAAQWPTETKSARADFVIDTAGSFDDTDRQVDDVLRAVTS